MPAAAGVLVAVQAAAASLSILMVPVALAWATASFSSAPWIRALQFGAGAWLLAHHAGIVIPGGHVGLVPLGLLALPLMCCWVAGVRLARALDPNAIDLRAGVGRAEPVMPPTRALVCMVATYSGLVTVVSVLATSVSVRPLAAQAFVGAAMMSALGGLCGAAAWAGGGAIAGFRLILKRIRLPDPVTWVGRPVLAALAVQLAAGVLIGALAVAFGWNRIMLLHHAIAPGLTGGLVLTVAQLMVLPNLVVWAVSFAAGPGFAIGAGTSVTAGHVSLGLLPAVPVLGALPEPGTRPVWAWAVLALPVLSGVVPGLLIVRRDPDAGVASVLADIGVATLLTGLLWALLGWLSGGPAGPGTLEQIGPELRQLGPAMMAETGAGALITAGVLLTVRSVSRARSQTPHEPAAQD